MALFAVRKANTLLRICGIRAEANSTSRPPVLVRYSCIFLREGAVSWITPIPKAASPEMWFCASRLCVPRIGFMLNAPGVSTEQEMFCEGAAPGTGNSAAAFGRCQHSRAGKCPLWPWISYTGHSRSNSQAPSGLAFHGFKQTITCK